jgi:hypothetical protein
VTRKRPPGGSFGNFPNARIRSGSKKEEALEGSWSTADLIHIRLMIWSFNRKRAL